MWMELWEKGKVYAWAWLWGLPAAAQPARDGRRGVEAAARWRRRWSRGVPCVGSHGRDWGDGRDIWQRGRMEWSA